MEKWRKGEVRRRPKAAKISFPLFPHVTRHLFALIIVISTLNNITTAADIPPREPIYFTDDFMVTPEEAKAHRNWRKLAGEWEFKTVRDDRKEAANNDFTARSANPFMYVGRPDAGKPYALSTTGESHWSEYAVQAAVKVFDSGAAGLAFGCNDENNFWLVRLECPSQHPAPSRLQLVRMADGKPEVIEEKVVAVQHGRWYQLGADVHKGRARIRFNGRVVIDHSDMRVTGGPVGVYSETKSGFDDVEVHELGHILFDRESDLQNFGEQVSGKWSVKQLPNVPPYLQPPKGSKKKPPVVLFGNRDWLGGAVTAEVRTGGGSVALIAGADGEASYAFEISGDGTGRLIERTGEASRVLDSFKYPLIRSDEWCPVGLNVSEPGVISAHIGERLVARARISKEPVGRIGVMTSGQKGAAVRNLKANRSSRLLSEHNISNAVFLGDAYMSSWATESGQWIPNDGIDLARSMKGFSFDPHKEFWRKGEYYGDYSIVLPLTVDNKPLTGFIAAHVGTTPTRGYLACGYMLKVRPLKDKKYSAELTSVGKVIASAEFELPGDGCLRLYNTARHLWVMSGKNEIISHTKETPDEGRRIALSREGKIDFEKVAVHAEQLVDASFDSAPFDWDFMNDWEVSPRFTCDPRWSWMGINSTGVFSAMWHRDNFPGDVTVEFYAAFQMRGGAPHYAPSDLNITIAASEENPASGYSFIIDGWKNQKTALLRKGAIVATTSEQFLPDTRVRGQGLEELHRRWFFVKVRRTGRKVELFCDNKLMLSYDDPYPLPGGRIGVWTQDQSVTVSRVRIYHSKRDQHYPLIGEKPLDIVKASPTSGIKTNGRFGHYFDFERGFEGWDSGSAALTILEQDKSGTSLKVINSAPGRFFVRAPVQDFNALQCPVLSFDCRIPRGVKVNLYFYAPTEKRRFFIRLTGSDTSTDIFTMAGEAKVRDDDRWYTVRLNLAKIMRKIYPRESVLQVSALAIGHFSHRGYEDISGEANRQGDSFKIRNFIVAGASAGPAVIELIPPKGTAVQYSYSLSDSPAPADMTELKEPKITLNELPEGLTYLRVQSTLGGEVMVFPLLQAAPQMPVLSQPKSGGAWGGEAFEIKIAKEQLAVLDLHRLEAFVGEQKLSIADESIEVDWRRGVIKLIPSRSPAQFKDGAEVKCKLSIRGFGQPEPTALSWSAIYSVKNDVIPPSMVTIAEFPDTGAFDSAERWKSHGDTVSRNTIGKAEGSRAVGVTITSDLGAFSARVPVNKLRLDKFPILDFDYRAEPGTLFDLILSTTAGDFTVGMLDKFAGERIGTIPNVLNDGVWHSASVDFLKLLWQREKAAQSTIQALGFGDHHQPGGRVGAHFEIANLRLVSLASAKTGSELKVSANDLSGIAGYAFRWSNDPLTEVPKEVNLKDGVLRIEGLEEGRQYLHIRSVDIAGNWSESSHYAFKIDNTPPVIADVLPKPENFPADKITIKFEDEYLGRRPSAALSWQGGVLDFGTAEQFKEKHHFGISLDVLAEKMPVIPDKAEVTMTISDVIDAAGNKIEPQLFKWTMDYSKSNFRPQSVEFEPLNAKLAFSAGYDSGVDGAVAEGKIAAARVLSQERLSHVLSFKTQEAAYAVLLNKGKYNLAETGILKFDMHTKGEAFNLDLMVKGPGFSGTIVIHRPHPVKPENAKPENEPIGAMTELRLSKEWAMFWVDVYALVQAKWPELKDFTVEEIRIGRSEAPFGKPNHIEIDNVMLYGRAKNRIELAMKSRHIAGIKSYAVMVAGPGKALSGDPNSPPQFIQPAEQGVNYVYAYAFGNDGNRSRLVSVLPYIVEKEEPPPPAPVEQPKTVEPAPAPVEQAPVPQPKPENPEPPPAQ